MCTLVVSVSEWSGVCAPIGVTDLSSDAVYSPKVAPGGCL
jgi:hypothetical protein